MKAEVIRTAGNRINILLGRDKRRIQDRIVAPICESEDQRAGTWEARCESIKARYRSDSDRLNRVLDLIELLEGPDTRQALVKHNHRLFNAIGEEGNVVRPSNPYLRHWATLIIHDIDLPDHDGDKGVPGVVPSYNATSYHSMASLPKLIAMLEDELSRAGQRC